MGPFDWTGCVQCIRSPARKVKDCTCKFCSATSVVSGPSEVLGQHLLCCCAELRMRSRTGPYNRNSLFKVALWGTWALLDAHALAFCVFVILIDLIVHNDLR